MLAEIRNGIELVRGRDPAKARALQRWPAEPTTGHADRMLAIGAGVAKEWGRMRAIRRAPVVDTLLAATATVHRLTLVTRNHADVTDLGAAVLNRFDRYRDG